MSAIDLEDEDSPLAVGGAAYGSPLANEGKPRKKGGMPPWVILFVGGIAIFVVLGLLVMTITNRPAPGRTTQQSVEEEVSLNQTKLGSAQDASRQPQQPSTQMVAISAPVGNTESSSLTGSGTTPVTTPPIQTTTTPTTASSSESANVEVLRSRVIELEERVDQLTATITGQSPAMRRIITDRAQRDLRPLQSTTPRRVPSKAKAVKTSTPQPVHQIVSGDFAIHAVIGARAWLRPSGSNEAEVIVTTGDLVNGSRVKEVQAKRVTLENGIVIE